MKHWFIVLVVFGCLFAGGLWLSRSAADQPNEEAVKAFMRGKLDSAQDVLEGLVTEDFEKIEQGADRMRVMGRRAEWNVLKTHEYELYSAQFQRAAEQLAKAGKNKKLDSAALAYLQLTMTCINCHKHVRGVKIADLPREQRRLLEPRLVLNAVTAADRAVPAQK